MRIETRGKLIKSGMAVRDRNKNTFAYYVGIDPDVERSGYAVYKKSEKKLVQCTTLSFLQLQEMLKRWSLYREPNKVVVHIEGAWLNEKSNWHVSKHGGIVTEKDKRIGERIAKNVGSNHQVGKLIVDICVQYDLSFVVRDVITPHFKDEERFKKMTQWKHLTNMDARSAANYIFGF